jgi:hypothetical protein
MVKSIHATGTGSIPFINNNESASRLFVASICNAKPFFVTHFHSFLKLGISADGNMGCEPFESSKK